jgi:hypothetical protein
VISDPIGFSEKVEVTHRGWISLELAGSKAWGMESGMGDSAVVSATGQANGSASALLSVDFDGSLVAVGSHLRVSHHMSMPTDFLGPSIEAPASTLFAESLFVRPSGVGPSAEISATALFLDSQVANSRFFLPTLLVILQEDAASAVRISAHFGPSAALAVSPTANSDCFSASSHFTISSFFN